jgi:Cu-Zn family superoxide dismutase
VKARTGYYIKQGGINMKRYVGLAYFFILALLISACGVKETNVQPAAAAETAVVNVNFINAKGANIGKAQLTQAAEGVKIHLEASKLPPGTHGFHIHETGMCEKPDFASAGPHLNLLNKQHGFLNPLGFHTGDLPNIQVGANGKVTADMIAKSVTLEKDKPNSILRTQGASLMIHEKADDYKTDPTGNSGGRIACGVIK